LIPISSDADTSKKGEYDKAIEAYSQALTIEQKKLSNFLVS
jgi:hypothetical protein